ncbi:MAG: hypothetical protein SH847_02310 [Roseiflexaceae bacterium]|nr:hypothetical protein [Roseiflexaceae bacterium]
MEFRPRQVTDQHDLQRIRELIQMSHGSIRCGLPIVQRDFLYQMPIDSGDAPTLH